MLQYIVQRIFKGALTFLAAITVTFLIVRLMPGDPTTAFISDSMSPQDVAYLNTLLGLDKSLLEQYWLFLRNLAHLELGQSFFLKEPVGDIILPCLGWTLLLVGTSLAITLMIGIPLGVYTARHKGNWIDQSVSTLIVLGISIFIPLIAFILVYVFSLELDLTPVGGAVTPGIDDDERLLEIAYHMILPTITLVIVNLAQIVLYTRSSMLDVLKEDYIRTARAKGLSEREVVSKHALRNALLPVATVVGLSLGGLLSGAVLTETIFGFAGIGRTISDAITARDYVVVQGVTVIVSVGYVVVNLIVDISYAYLDPRVRINS